MKIRNTCMLLFLLFSSLTLCKQKQPFVNINAQNVKLLSCDEMRFCYISFVEVEGKKFLVKQKKIQNKMLGAVRDAITAHIAESLDIAHKVVVIPADKDFPGKVIKGWPATIHTIAPGKMIKRLDTKLKKMNIKQADIGFRRDMLPWMAQHPTLTQMVGMDTFLCNHDRHRGNLFYDAKNDSYCAIDMDSSFKYNLCALACKNFTKMMNSNILFPLSKKELEALVGYKNILVFLIDKHKPEDTIQMFDYFVEQAGFVEGSPLYTEKIHLELERNRAMIRQSYQDAIELVKILNKILKRVVRY